MQCNLDSRGKAVRLVSGAVVAAVGVVIAALALARVWSGWLAWSGAGVLIAAGGFQIYEGWRGWCVLRAMGFRTPL